MLVKYDVNPLEIENISHSVTLVPRLEYSVNLLDEIIDILNEKQIKLKESNKELFNDFDESDKIHVESLKLEHLVTYSLNILQQVKKNMKRISNVSSIPEVLPSSIPMIRTVSAKLFDIIPVCSQKLSEISVHLGSIVLDSAALTTASFDFSQSNNESSTSLNEVKLMVDSKLSKQYPNLDFFKLCNT
ncbi:hypothetical protein C5F47_03040 [Nitrosopumilus cobalaminigenes]|uniref:Uncharacterized protein n=1 Tax=Nitrosopumilus cobalaminigenes TaxID=1470066 RepID=A0A7D5LZ27_9ARCH|nr:hypothetical protein [Nitrosopumilus cobalaminigenes]QLH02606.1 hypothetical protein C5F47_03040 [Nitrosopumilus cobalaminigenes]